MSFKRLSIPKLPAQNKSILLYDGVKQYAVFNINGNFVAFNNRCPHAGASLCKGELLFGRDGRAQIKCPRHGWVFQLDDGVSVRHPTYALSLYKVEWEGDNAYIVVPDEIF